MPPRPRPRPRARTAATLSPTDDSATSTPEATSSTSPHIVDLDAEDALFIRKQRSARSWKEIEELERATARAKIRNNNNNDSDHNTDGETPHTPRRRRRAKQSPSFVPEWTRSNKVSLKLSDTEPEDDGISIVDRPSNSATLSQSVDGTNKRKRPRSRSRSLTPPPQLSRIQLENAKNIVRRTLHTGNRPPSPTYSYYADKAAESIELNPELARIALEINAQAVYFNDDSRPSSEARGPEAVTVKVRWINHPGRMASSSEQWTLKMKRNDDFHSLFEEVADRASILTSRLVVSYDSKRVFASATPNSLGTWAELEFEACDRDTYDHIKHQRARARSPSVALVDEPNARNHSPSVAPIFEEPESAVLADHGPEEAKFKIVLRSIASSKNISLTVRPTTTCNAIVQAYVKACKLQPTLAIRARLVVDGDKLDPTSQISDADLEDGDMVEVVGL